MIQSITFFDSPEDIIKSYADKAIKKVNTWDDWHILPVSRPVFTSPEVKTNYIDVPGGNGALDLTEALTRFPTYNNREGTFEFRVMNDYEKDGKTVYESNDNNRWAQRYSEIMEYIHGKSLCAVLEDDPTWFYQGRFYIDDGWKPGDTWSTVTIGYTVNPFKWSISSSTSDWLWDPFNFETDVTWDLDCSDIRINNPNGFTSITLPSEIADKNSMPQFFGRVPISPTITVSDLEGASTGIDIRFVNTYLGIDLTQHFRKGTTFAPDFIFYGQTEPYTLYFKGKGIVSIDFRTGRL